jgi:hypothetical protein
MDIDVITGLKEFTYDTASADETLIVSTFRETIIVGSDMSQKDTLSEDSSGYDTGSFGLDEEIWEDGDQSDVCLDILCFDG